MAVFKTGFGMNIKFLGLVSFINDDGLEGVQHMYPNQGHAQENETATSLT